MSNNSACVHAYKREKNSQESVLYCSRAVHVCATQPGLLCSDSQFEPLNCFYLFTIYPVIRKIHCSSINYIGWLREGRRWFWPVLKTGLGRLPSACFRNCSTILRIFAAAGTVIMDSFFFPIFVFSFFAVWFSLCMDLMQIDKLHWPRGNFKRLLARGQYWIFLELTFRAKGIHGPVTS